MARVVIEVPVGIYDAIQQLQHRILAHEVEPDEARAEMSGLLAPFLHEMPDENTQTVIKLRTTVLHRVNS